MARLRAALIEGEENGEAPEGTIDRVVARIQAKAAAPVTP
jgi:hypothetical protein